ncbi:hypothetical protein diail_7670, partial [Diaporthe ilicicola]
MHVVGAYPQSIRGEIKYSSRILALHGGGTNSRIFKAQCRALEASLNDHGIRLVYAEAPFSSVPGPDVLSVYSKRGPFKAWLRSPDVTTPKAQDLAAVERAILEAVRADDELGGTGAWIAVLGFSQGAKIAASLLLQQQRRRTHHFNFDFSFGVLLAGRGPLIDFCPDLELEGQEMRLFIPSIHVHGYRDPGLSLHRKMLDQCCARGTTYLVNWDGDHRLPIKKGDVQKVVSAILEMRLHEPTLDVLPDNILIPRPAQTLDLELHVTVEEERHAVALLGTERNNSVSRAAVVTIRPQLHYVAHVDDECIFLDRDRNPRLSGRVPDLEALAVGLLQEDGDTTKIGVVANCITTVDESAYVFITLK